MAKFQASDKIFGNKCILANKRQESRPIYEVGSKMRQFTFNEPWKRKFGISNRIPLLFSNIEKTFGLNLTNVTADFIHTGSLDFISNNQQSVQQMLLPNTYKYKAVTQIIGQGKKTKTTKIKTISLDCSVKLS